MLWKKIKRWTIWVWQKLHFDVCLGYLLGMWWIKGQFPVQTYAGGFLRSFISWRGSVSQIGPWWHSKSGSISAKYIFLQCTAKATIWVAFFLRAGVHWFFFSSKSVVLSGFRVNQRTRKNNGFYISNIVVFLSFIFLYLYISGVWYGRVWFIFMSLDLVFLYFMYFLHYTNLYV